ncbi:uncharacterized protein LOC106650231 [Trichogramma pretiosum]|uniref:uncharacterized protein LOC106650231 n=1 Tax=Trichogramma pretiosum TaxID=7493 RepID=UPI0006C95739|nr:uncharacterized protein LOC106650231 [Trichogramma pretiosum]
MSLASTALGALAILSILLATSTAALTSKAPIAIIEESLVEAMKASAATAVAAAAAAVDAPATTTTTTTTTQPPSTWPSSTQQPPPRQELLVSLNENTTTRDSLEERAGGAIVTPATSWDDEPLSLHNHEISPSPMRISTTRLEVTTAPVESIITPKATTSPTNLAINKITGSKTRNELIDENKFKLPTGTNRGNQGYMGGKKPNLQSVLGKYTPYFEDGHDVLNVTSRIGSTVMLDCEIGMLGNKTVTWSYHSADVIRLLTVGRNAYSVDQRISLFFRYPTNWRLRIQNATPHDSGLYECQVATYPPLVKKIYLLVTAPILAIMDDSGRIKSGERHLKAGSALRLRCEARDVPEHHNETVIWTRGDEILSEDISENKTTDYMEGREIQVVSSTIVIERATPRHAGNYSCVVPEKARATVAVHVLNGELPAAVHDGNGVSRSVLNLWLIHLTVSYVFSR